MFSAALQNRLKNKQCVTALTPMKICSSYRCAVMQHQSTAALVRAEKVPHCSVLLCIKGSQNACASAITPEEICSSYRCAVMQHQSTAALVRAEKVPHCSVLLCKTGSQHACATAITPEEICSSYRCAVMQHQSTAQNHCLEVHFQAFFSGPSCVLMPLSGLIQMQLYAASHSSG